MKHHLLILLVLLSGCGNDQGEVSTKMEKSNPVVKIDVDGSFDALFKSSPLRFSEECPASMGICWYKINMRSGDPSIPNVVVDVAGDHLTVDKVTDISVSRVTGEENVTDFDLTLLGLPDNTSHEDNRKWVYELLNGFKLAGWKKYFYPADPRISGDELAKIPQGKQVFGEYPLSHPMFDPDVSLALDKWMEVKSFYNWYMYKGNEFVHVMVQRSDSDTEPKSKGTYLTVIEFTSQENTWKLDFKEEDRADWKQKFPARLNELLARRAEAEKLARLAGVQIQENYQAPDIESSVRQ